jgi:hypothetical protein
MQLVPLQLFMGTGDNAGAISMCFLHPTAFKAAVHVSAGGVHFSKDLGSGMLAGVCAVAACGGLSGCSFCYQLHVSLCDSCRLGS